MEVNGYQQLFGYKHSLKYFVSIIYFNRRKQLVQVWNNLRVSKWWQNYNFCVNYAFKTAKRCMKMNGCGLSNGNMTSYSYVCVFAYSGSSQMLLNPTSRLEFWTLPSHAELRRSKMDINEDKKSFYWDTECKSFWFCWRIVNILPLLFTIFLMTFFPFI